MSRKRKILDILGMILGVLLMIVNGMLVGLEYMYHVGNEFYMLTTMRSSLISFAFSMFLFLFGAFLVYRGPRDFRRYRRYQRWDSDHVVLFDDETKEIAQEIVRCEGGLDRTYIALDYFDASINRISAWVTGFRSFQKALLNALCTPSALLKELQDTNQMSKKMVVMEECKTLPIGDIWEEYCRRCNVPAEGWFEEIEKYETEVLVKRA